MRFHVGSDHGGVALRAVLIEALEGWEQPVLSVSGPATTDERADYPNVAVEVCRRVVEARSDGAEDVFGLLICGTGQGMAMTANKLPGIRAGVVADAFSAKMIRAHNDANVLCLGERVLGTELAKLLLRAFIDTEFEAGRHARRVELIASAGTGPGGGEQGS
ncbi:ribose 5-phosphate isomerase B [Pseudenhygromyxa sp. WMMC2535]|uniref:ribose 5-phosphate isomerase B n=1 Tax=Pseudenhygromyxa sp. WMMC2535 TaxID=2712867 RepID=UPI001552F267|nr:ribose 5-phosphate isomerase B [Pseudenhygromyxa sp. WMMC2535]NVB41647.1 ribose 5-phosphate isomerase B [Pseudenhygromyxa sp. WMMC2535]